MKEIRIALLITLVILVLLIPIIGFGAKILKLQQERLQAEIQWEKQKIELEMKRVCQELDAETYKKEWGYKSCRQELKFDKTTETLL